MNPDTAIDDGTRQRVERCVIEAIAGFGADRAQVTADASLVALDTDVLDILELSQIVSDTFGVRIRAKDAERLETVRDAIDLVVSRLGTNGAAAHIPS
jgi:acyl carrier protein